jgi:tetratricopeptide (TPR) repeat protein
LVLLLLDYWPLGRIKEKQKEESRKQRSEIRNQRSEGSGQKAPGVPFWGLVKEKAPLFAFSAASCVVAALMPGLVVMDVHHLPLFARIGNAVVSYAVYLGQMVFPAGLATPYPSPQNGQPMWKVCMAFVVLAAISWGVMAWRKKRPYLLAGWLWYLVMLLPVIGIIQISSDAAHADRYSYLPGIGFAMALTWAVADGCAAWPHRQPALGGLMIAVVGALSFCAHIQTSYWRDEESLWTRALDCTSDNYAALDSMGDVLVKQGKLDLAIAYFQKALEIRPGYIEADNDLGTALFAQGKLDEAIALLQKALAIQPGYAEAHYNLGNVLVRQGKLDEAIAHYRKAVQLNPDYAAAQNNLGQALLLKGDSAGGMACLEKAAALFPDPPGRWFNLGNEFLQQGKFQQAIMFFRQATRINPRFADAWAGLGTACSKSGQSSEAIDAWHKALELARAQKNDALAAALQQEIEFYHTKAPPGNAPR